MPALAPTVVTNFDGSDQTVCGSCQPPDPNAATNGSQIVELVNAFFQVTDNNGAALVECGGGVKLASFLGTTDSLTDPRVQWDNVNQRFSFSVTLNPASSSATPAMWIAASQTADPCGSWWVYRLTFSGGSFPAGTFLDFPMLGQDRNALLISTRNFTHPGTNFAVFGVSKSLVYTGASVNFSTFSVPSLTAPVTNAGIPMVSSPVSFFLAAVPGTGYRLFRLTNSGGSGASLSQTTISAPFNAPTRQANQPFTTSTLDPSDGNILWTPYYDGASIWFTHDYDLAGFPTVRYGAVNVSANTVATATAYHSGTSDDFDAALGIGLNPGGGVFVYLTWTYTDAPAGVAASDTVDGALVTGGIPNLIATGTVLVTGSTTTETRFGDYSSVSVDPTVSGGGCAVVADQYFGTNAQWRTRIARVGSCQPQPLAVVPNLAGDTTTQAASDLATNGLRLGAVSSVTDPTCNNIGTVLSQNPAAGTQLPPGSSVNIVIGTMPPPPFQCP
ncbi:MAG TPA: PASTA domain-containing protein [Rugosimonospora sp.]|nr:PASTA domain-containing protein [Rugosimonospora sp.]